MGRKNKALVLGLAAATLIGGFTAIPAAAVGPGVAISCPTPKRVVTRAWTYGTVIVHRQRIGSGYIYEASRSNPLGYTSMFDSMYNAGQMAVASTGYRRGTYGYVDSFDANCE